LNIPVAAADKKNMPADTKTSRSGFIASCKNFAFNLF
jgi:hypothetical protein